MCRLTCGSSAVRLLELWVRILHSLKSIRRNNLYFQNINLQPGTELREMWSNFPDPVGFKVYLFNVTNPTEIQKGEKPALREVGPYVYE